MRIVAEIPHPEYKITVLHHQNRYTIQVENGSLSQHYRYRQQPGLEQASEIEKLINPAFITGVTAVFKEMEAIHHRGLPVPDEEEDQFEEII
jgi:hypothetical protein